MLNVTFLPLRLQGIKEKTSFLLSALVPLWLKIMKKVHVENEVETTAQTDNNVQALAENRNTSTEVLTESMAEVFARQGKTDKASEVYQKLSLLNPAKSTYFAAKIENLKGI